MTETTNGNKNFFKMIGIGFDKHPAYLLLIVVTILCFIFAAIWNFGAGMSLVFNDKQIMVISAADFREAIKLEAAQVAIQIEQYESEIRIINNRMNKLELSTISCIRSFNRK